MMDITTMDFSDFDFWRTFVKKMHELLNAAPLVKVLFLIGFNCGLCCNYFIMMRSRPCYHILTCHKCMPRSKAIYCSEECGQELREPMPYEMFRKYCMEVLDKGQYLTGFSMTFSLKISPEGAFFSNMYQRLQDSSRIKTVEWRRHDF